MINLHHCSYYKSVHGSFCHWVLLVLNHWHVLAAKVGGPNWFCSYLWTKKGKCSKGFYLPELHLRHQKLECSPFYYITQARMNSSFLSHCFSLKSLKLPMSHQEQGQVLHSAQLRIECTFAQTLWTYGRLTHWKWKICIFD